VKIIEACLELYYNKDYQTNGNPDGQAGDVYNGVIPVPDQTSESSFETVP
jgi:hypothetical protein